MTNQELSAAAWALSEDEPPSGASLAEPSDDPDDVEGSAASGDLGDRRSRRSSGMWRLIRNRTLWAVPTLLVVSLGIFALVDLAPGDVAVSVAGENATPEQIERIRENLRLNDPLIVRYFSWLGDAARGDLGESLTRREPVSTIIGRGLPQSLSLLAVTMAGTVLVAVALGSLAAMRPKGVLDRLLSIGSAVAIAVPSLFLTLFLVSELAVRRKVLPAIGYTPFGESPWQWLQHLIIPAIALGALPTGEVARQLRSSLREVLDRDYILTAHAKGLPMRRVVLKHALKNAGIPVLTVLGARFSLLLGGTVLVETIMVIRGIGSTLVLAVIARDVPLVTGITVVTMLLVLVGNLVVDILYGVMNPKLRVS